MIDFFANPKNSITFAQNMKTILCVVSHIDAKGTKIQVITISTKADGMKVE